MAENSNIEWCHHTFNPVRGCTKVSDGCRNCYADTLSERNPTTLGIWGPNGTRIVASAQMWNEPLKWNEKLKNQWVCQCGFDENYVTQPLKCPQCKDGVPTQKKHRVFCASLADIFEDWTKGLHYPAKDDQGKPTIHAAWFRPGKGIVKAGQTSVGLNAGERLATMQDVRDQLFQLIEATPNLDWLLLTKRPENILRMTPNHWRTQFPLNVWMGTSVENQAMAEQRIPHLLKVPARVRFLSCEPLLGPVDLTDLILDDGNLGEWHVNSLDNEGLHPADDPAFKGATIHWVIAGGESGPNSRPMHPGWARSLRDQCSAAGVPFLFKQHGDWFPRSEWQHNPTLVLPDDSDIYNGQEKLIQNQKHLYFLENEFFHNVGKKKAGRLLNGHEHNGYPSSHLPVHA